MASHPSRTVCLGVAKHHLVNPPKTNMGRVLGMFILKEYVHLPYWFQLSGSSYDTRVKAIAQFLERFKYVEMLCRIKYQ